MAAGRRSWLVGLTTATYRLVLRFWTRSLRDRYRAEAVHLFRSRVQAARVRGRAAAAGVAFRGLADAIRELGRGAPRRKVPARRDAGSGTIPSGEAMTHLMRDVRLAARRLRGSPRFSLAMIVTFAIAVGVTAATHAAVHRLLLAPLPFPEAERLVYIGEIDDGDPDFPSVTSRYVLDLLDRTATSLDSVAVYNIAGATLTHPGDPATLNGATVTANYFDVLGVGPRLGRVFSREDDDEGAPARVIVSHALWRDRLGSDPDALGDPIELDGTPYELVGVMPPGFESPDEYSFTNHVRGRPAFWITYRSFVPDSLGRSHRGIGRLVAGATLEQLRAEAAALPARIEADGLTWPEGHRVVAQGLQEHVTAAVRPALRLLALAVAFVFLAACVNAMGLSFARGLDRLGELRVKGALGARRGRLLRDLAMEPVILGVVGGVLGLGLGALSLDRLVHIAPADLPRVDTINLELSTLLPVMTITLVAAVAVGLVPGLRLLWRWDRVHPGAGGASSTTRRSHRRTLDLFSGAQVALALMLLTGSALLVRSFVQLTGVDLGFEPHGLTIAVTGLPASSPAERRALEGELLRRLAEDPAIASAALATTAPQHGLNDFQIRLTIEGHEEQEAPISFYRRVTDDFAEAMRLRLIQGRFLRFDEVVTTEEGLIGPVVVNRTFAERYLDGRDPLGVELTFGGWGFHSTRVVGVVDDALFGWPGAPPEPSLYLPMVGDFSTVFVLARAAAEIDVVPARIRAAVRDVAPGAPVDDVFFSERLVRATTARTEMTMTLLLGLALFTTLLTCVGLYGIVAHAIVSRRRELGIRMANGATTGRVVAMVVREGMRPILAGLVLGALGAVAASRLTEALLFGVERGDPSSYVAAALFLTAMGAAACYVPARRLRELDPTEALRQG